MEFVKGQVVRCGAGRDQGGFFVIVGIDGRNALICDGRRRVLERPKKKNVLHLSATSTVLPDGSMRSNREIRNALRPFAGQG